MPAQCALGRAVNIAQECADRDMETLAAKGASAKSGAEVLNARKCQRESPWLSFFEQRYKMTIGFQNFRNFMEAGT